MNTYTSSKDDLLNALQQYTEFLHARKETLEELSGLSDELLNSLQMDSDVDIKKIMERRKNQYLKLRETASRNVNENTFLELVRQASKAANEDIRFLAQDAIASHGESKILMESILVRQNECEAMLKDKLQSIAKAIMESKQRGQLGAAYGPACTHAIPKFLDTRK